MLHQAFGEATDFTRLWNVAKRCASPAWAQSRGPESGDLQGGSHVAEVVNTFEFDLIQQDSDSEVQSCSDESVVQPRRRLRLVWDAHVVDLRRTWHPEARGVEGLFHNLASRIGAVLEGSEVPRAVRQQRWSLANVPLMWGVSGNADSTPALDWLMETVGRMSEPIEFYGGRISARDALRTGWSSLRVVFREWGIAESDLFTTWLRRQGFGQKLFSFRLNAGTVAGNSGMGSRRRAGLLFNSFNVSSFPGANSALSCRQFTHLDTL